jgi:hypothetical protein
MLQLIIVECMGLRKKLTQVRKELSLVRGGGNNMKHQNTRLESEGAEFLVLGHLLILGIPAYKAYTNMPGHDLEVTNPGKGVSARISVKSRWRTTATGFIIKDFDCEFVVVAKLNRGSKDGSGEIKSPQFFILPVDIVRNVPRDKSFNKIPFGKIPNFESYENGWDLIKEFLKL